jgi:hypothetical protein
MKNAVIIVFILLVISCKDSKTQELKGSLKDEVAKDTKLSCEDIMFEIVTSSDLNLKDYKDYFVRIERIENDSITLQVYIENNLSDNPKEKQMVESTLAWLLFLPNEQKLLNVTADPDNPVEMDFDKKILSRNDVFNLCQIMKKQDHDFFVGESVIGTDSYFDNLTEGKGYSILTKQNEFYQKNYAGFLNTDIYQLSSGNVNFKFEKQFLNSEKKYRIVLYTYFNSKKKDSIEFFRNVDDLEYEPSHYTCLSYLDLKNKKIWQMKYFSSTADKSIGYILYKKNKIMENGKIETDSLFYLDESLDVEMEKNKLYY